MWQWYVTVVRLVAIGLSTRDLRLDVAAWHGGRAATERAAMTGLEPSLGVFSPTLARSEAPLAEPSDCVTLGHHCDGRVDGGRRPGLWPRSPGLPRALPCDQLHTFGRDVARIHEPSVGVLLEI